MLYMTTSDEKIAFDFDFDYPIPDDELHNRTAAAQRGSGTTTFVRSGTGRQRPRTGKTGRPRLRHSGPAPGPRSPASASPLLSAATGSPPPAPASPHARPCAPPPRPWLPEPCPDLRFRRSGTTDSEHIQGFTPGAVLQGPRNRLALAHRTCPSPGHTEHTAPLRHQVATGDVLQQYSLPNLVLFVHTVSAGLI